MLAQYIGKSPVGTRRFLAPLTKAITERHGHWRMLPSGAHIFVRTHTMNYEEGFGPHAALFGQKEHKETPGMFHEQPAQKPERKHAVLVLPKKKDLHTSS